MIARIVGLCSPSPHEAPFAAHTLSARRIARFVGCHPEDLTAHFFLTNLLSYPSIDRERLADAAARMPLGRHDCVILVGTEVYRAFGQRAYPSERVRPLGWARRTPVYCCWYRSVSDALMAVLPHPSGRNRWYNDKQNEESAAKFLRHASNL